MKTLLALLLTALSCFVAQQPPTTWKAYFWGGNQYRPVAADTSFAFRTEGSKDAFCAFLILVQFPGPQRSRPRLHGSISGSGGERDAIWPSTFWRKFLRHGSGDYA